MTAKATARIVITDDATGSGITVVIDSDPAIPVDEHDRVAVHECTPAQLAVVYAGMQLHSGLGISEWRTFVAEFDPDAPREP